MENSAYDQYLANNKQLCGQDPSIKNRNTLKMTERELLRSNLPKYIAESRSARGRVWVPTVTKKEMADKYQYWNKFKMTKTDFLFQEVVEKFKKKDVDKRLVESGARNKSGDRRSRSAVTRPYPSGSCNTILTGKSKIPKIQNFASNQFVR